MRAITHLSILQVCCAAPRMPVPHRHVKGQGHHRVPQPSKPSK